MRVQRFKVYGAGDDEGGGTSAGKAPGRGGEEAAQSGDSVYHRDGGETGSACGEAGIQDIRRERMAAGIQETV